MGCAGKGREMRALPAPEPTRRITTHPHSAPLHKIRTDDMLPLQLLDAHPGAPAHTFIGQGALTCSTAAEIPLVSQNAAAAAVPPQACNVGST